MKELGIKSFRFSFSWSRILPEGTGKINPAGIDYYRKLIDCLKENGIVPNATMFHWDLPYALQIQGGFGNRDCVKWFTEYAGILLDHFGKDVDFWATFNEPIAMYVGHKAGYMAPGLKNEKYARQCLHNMLLCHGETVRLFREKNPGNARIGIVVDVWPHYPADPENEADRKLAFYNSEMEGFGIFLHPLFLGGYSEELLRYMKENDVMPEIREGDFDIISRKMDFYGLNFYNGLFDSAEEEARKSGDPLEDWKPVPDYHEAVYKVLHMLTEKYKIGIPIYITENGKMQTEQENTGALLDDRERIDYLEQVLVWVHKAIADGIDVRGYYIWSLLDNFEWSSGYSARFGLYYTDYKTQERIPKKSAQWYKDVIGKNGFER